GPILHPAQVTLYTDACIIPILHPRKADFSLHRSTSHKLGNTLALPGAVQRKEEACSGANVPSCYFAGLENNCATNQEKIV
ncbi:hypothetical protein PO909_015316, partial [Leuciscus waleckii]